MTITSETAEGGHRLGALWAQGLMRLIGLRIAPALAAGLLSLNHLGDPGQGAIVFVAVMGAGYLLDRSWYPFHLMPFAATLARGAVPVLGVVMAAIAITLSGGSMSGGFVAPVLGAWTAMALGAFWIYRVRSSRPIRVAVIGSRGLATGLAEELSAAGIDAYRVIGWVTGHPADADTALDSPQHLGSLEEVRKVVTKHSIDLLVYGGTQPGPEDSGQHTRLEIFEKVASSCLDLPVRMIEANQLYEEALAHVPLGQSNSAWFQYLLHPRYRAGVPGAKRAFDLSASLLMLLLALPVLAVSALAIKLTDRGPVFYRQRRVGERGREFEMIKMRSMYQDAESGGEARWASAEDDRVTPIGRIMRATHLDELAQLWNVIRGDMTLVGPRPERRELIDELEIHLPYYDRRHLVKPGIAGWAQARCGYGGSEEGTGWKLCHDLYYLKRRSVYFDALILVENVAISLAPGVSFKLRAPREQFILGPATTE